MNNGGAGGPAELDPTGGNTGLANPYVVDPDPVPEEGGHSLFAYPTHGTPRQRQASYSRNGIPISFDHAMMLINAHPSGSFALLYASLNVTNYRWVNRGSLTIRIQPGVSSDPEVERAGSVYGTFPLGYWQPTAMSATPSLSALIEWNWQKRQPSEEVRVPLKDINELKNLMHNRLDYGDCKAAVAKLLAQLSKNAGGKNNATTTDMMGLFNKIESAGGIRINVPRGEYPPNQPRVAGGSGLSWIEHVRISAAEVKIERKTWIYQMSAYKDSRRLAFDRIPYEYGITAIHEMLHHAAQGTYTEEELDNAARDLDPKVGSIDTYLRNHCSPPEMR